MNQKTKEFFKGTSEILQLIETDSNLDSFFHTSILSSNSWPSSSPPPCERERQREKFY
jgi:hypothetical protein